MKVLAKHFSSGVPSEKPEKPEKGRSATPVTYRVPREVVPNVDKHVVQSRARWLVLLIGDPGCSLDIPDWLMR